MHARKPYLRSLAYFHFLLGFANEIEHKIILSHIVPIYKFQYENIVRMIAIDMCIISQVEVRFHVLLMRLISINSVHMRSI